MIEQERNTADEGMASREKEVSVVDFNELNFIYTHCLSCSLYSNGCGGIDRLEEHEKCPHYCKEGSSGPRSDTKAIVDKLDKIINDVEAIKNYIYKTYDK